MWLQNKNQFKLVVLCCDRRSGRSWMLTLHSDLFVPEQARLDGAICTITQAEQREYLISAQTHGVKNFEMETIYFCGLCREAGFRGTCRSGSFTFECLCVKVVLKHVLRLLLSVAM